MISSPTKIEETKSLNTVERAMTQVSEKSESHPNLQSISVELFVRINRINPRVLNIWKKILCPQREAAVISCSFLLLYCEVDASLKISPNARIPIDKAISTMKNYLANPGFVVTVIRRTKEYIDREMISVETIKRIHDLLSKVTIEQVKAMDKTLTGLALYDLIVWAVKYYEAYAREHYKVEILEGFGEAPLPEFPRSSTDIMNTSTPVVTKPKLSENKVQAEVKMPNTTRAKSNSDFVNKKTLESSARIVKPIAKAPISKPQSPPKRNTLPGPNSLKPCQTQRSLKQPSPARCSPLRTISKETPSIVRNSPKPIDRKIIAQKPSIYAGGSRSNNTTPVRSRKPNEGSVSIDFQKSNARDVLEEMQYHQFVEEKFRHFLIDKLRRENDKLAKAGMDKNEIKTVNEMKAVKNRAVWIQEFEETSGMTKFGSTKKLGDEKRFTAELIRAQRQLDILERYNS